MAREHRLPDDDDGRTIADMSGISAPSLFRPRNVLAQQEPERRKPDQKEHCRNDRAQEDRGMSRKERRMYVLGAMKAAMLLALAYLAGLGVVIFLLLKLWT